MGALTFAGLTICSDSGTPADCMPVDMQPAIMAFREVSTPGAAGRKALCLGVGIDEASSRVWTFKGRAFASSLATLISLIESCEAVMTDPARMIGTFTYSFGQTITAANCKMDIRFGDWGKAGSNYWVKFDVKFSEWRQ